MRKSVFKVLALLCITLFLLFCLSFLKVDTEYMVANSEGDYGKAGSEQRLEVQNTEAEEKDTILSEKKELGAKKYEVTAERKTSILGKKEADEKITGLEEQEEKTKKET